MKNKLYIEPGVIYNQDEELSNLLDSTVGPVKTLVSGFKKEMEGKSTEMWPVRSAFCFVALVKTLNNISKSKGNDLVLDEILDSLSLGSMIRILKNENRQHTLPLFCYLCSIYGKEIDYSDVEETDFACEQHGYLMMHNTDVIKHNT